jgi:hypothetical protein
MGRCNDVAFVGRRLHGCLPDTHHATRITSALRTLHFSLIWPDLASQQPIFIAFESGTPYPFRWAESANVRTSRSSALPPCGGI